MKFFKGVFSSLQESETKAACMWQVLLLQPAFRKKKNNPKSIPWKKMLQKNGLQQSLMSFLYASELYSEVAVQNPTEIEAPNDPDLSV